MRRVLRTFATVRCSFQHRTGDFSIFAAADVRCAYELSTGTPRTRRAWRWISRPLRSRASICATTSSIIDTLNERNAILNALRDGVTGMQQASDIQFKRIVQIAKRSWMESNERGIG